MRPKRNPAGYKRLCVSFYCDELQSLDNKVAALKKAGMTTMSRSRLLREAVHNVSIARVLRESGR